MKFKIFNISFILTLLSLCSCREEVLVPDNESENGNSGIPVEFIIEAPTDMGTKGVENPKTYFSPDDNIHVEATFFDKDDNIIGSSHYKMLQLNSEGEWKQLGQNLIYWPLTASRGVFKAYFVSAFNTSFEAGGNASQLKLADIKDDTDPLYAECDVQWGHRVNLSFRHICTHLTFTNLEPDITDYFWLINNGNAAFNNTFKLSLTSDYKLKAEFSPVPDNGYNGLVYVQRPSENLFTDGIKTGSRVSFFLQPGDYSNVELRTINNYSYLAFKSEETKELIAQTPYVVDVSRAKGVTIVEEDIPWDEDESKEVKIFDPATFIKHVTGNVDPEDDGDYYCKDENGVEHLVLQKTSTGVLLKCNVSFDNKKDYVLDFDPVIPTGRYFDGGNHYISDIARNIFSTNNGTIRHLWIKDITCTDIVLWRNGERDENNTWGVLCMQNTGIIDNVRLDNSTANFTIGNHESSDVFNVGSLVGDNSGTISDLSYKGTIRIETQQAEIQSFISLGGLIGQNTGLVKEINPIDANSELKVKFLISGNRTVLYLGGAIGISTTNVESVSLPNVEVDASEGYGLIGNTGGIIGRLRATEGTPSLLTSCTVGGTVKGLPVVESEGSYLSYTYTGGITGYNYNFSVIDCRTVCSVELTPMENQTGSITYGTGGGFGRIVQGNGEISGNYIFGSSLSGPDEYIGNFAGIVPSSMTWQEYQKSGNTARDLKSGKYIGTSLDDISSN